MARYNSISVIVRTAYLAKRPNDSMTFKLLCKLFTCVLRAEIRMQNEGSAQAVEQKRHCKQALSSWNEKKNTQYLLRMKV